MKKILAMLAAVCAAGVSLADSLNWKVSGTYGDEGKTVYILRMDGDITSKEAFDAAVVSSAEITARRGGSSYAAMASGVSSDRIDRDVELYAAMLDGDGKGFRIADIQSLAGNVYAPENQEPVPGDVMGITVAMIESGTSHSFGGEDPPGPEADVRYVEPVYVKPGDPTSGIACWTTNQCTAGVTLVASSDSSVTWGESGVTSWYLVTGSDVLINGGVTCLGDVRVILAQGSKLTVANAPSGKAGIATDPNGAFTVYGHRDGAGALEVSVSGAVAAIGGGRNEPGRNITINDGRVTVSGGGDGAGIGGGYQADGSNITINGGWITASGYGGGAAIGGGHQADGANITINGGIVMALGSDGAGIGGGAEGGAGSSITINGGEVTATNRVEGCAIGGGYNGPGYAITINGGRVTAVSSPDSFSAAGIGGSGAGDGYDIRINGGEVTACGSCGAAAIGGGFAGCGSNIVISAGRVAVRSAWAEIESQRYVSELIGSGTAGGPSQNNSVSGGASVLFNLTGIFSEEEGEIVDAYPMPESFEGFVILTPETATAATARTLVGGVADWTAAQTFALTNAATGATDAIDVGGSSVAFANTHLELTDTEGALKLAVVEPVLPTVDYAEPVYVTAGDPTSGIDRWETHSTNLYTVVTDQTTWDAGWYVVDSSVTIPSRITCNGDVRLILLDDCTLTASAGITVSGTGHSLTVYAPTADGTGELVAVTTADNDAGIGGASGVGQNITINGGVVTASGGKSAAGIGGGGAYAGLDITVNGGTVNASSRGTGNTGYGAGIGGGDGGNGERITINGGTVNASSWSCGAGIGGGGNGAGLYITINGGTVEAICKDMDNADYSGAGIGGGCNKEGGYITINGGEVTAWGGQTAAGLGGGRGGKGHHLTITNGTVVAKSEGFDESRRGNGWGAGIGGGDASGAGEDITISGGDVTAYNAGGYGAGIGGGSYNGTAKNIAITGGKVFAYVGGTGKGTAIGGANGAAVATGVTVATELLTLADNANPPTTVVENDGKDLASALSLKKYAKIFEVKAFSLAPESATLRPGETLDLALTVDPAELASLAAWSVSDESRVKILSAEGAGCQVQAVAGGEAAVVLTCADRQAVCSVSVVNPVDVPTVENGEVTAEPKEVLPGETVTLTVAPKAGYRLKSLSVIKKVGGEAVEVTEVDLGTYTFEMPDCGVTVAATFVQEQEPVPYLEPVYVTAGDPTSGLAGWQTETCSEYTVVTGTSERAYWGTEGTTNWYVVNGDVSFEATIVTCRGDVRLILADGADSATNTLYLMRSNIEVPQGSALTVYAQSADSRGAIFQNGIQVWGAGIGDGAGLDGSGAITINGGTVTVAGGDGSAGIGSSGTPSEPIVINGGTVTATGGEHGGPGIGSGVNLSGNHITINGGTVTARGGGDSAGIGGTKRTVGHHITINGGTVTAYAGGNAACIGGGIEGTGESITIAGGTVMVSRTPLDYEDIDWIGSGADCETPASNVVISAEAKVMFCLAQDATLPQAIDASTVMVSSTLVLGAYRLAGGVTNWVASPTFALVNPDRTLLGTLTVGDETGVTIEEKTYLLSVADETLVLTVRERSRTTTVAYRYPTYKTPDDPASGIAAWLTDTTEAIVVEDNGEVWGTAGADSWYVVTSGVTRSYASYQGHVHLILADGDGTATNVLTIAGALEAADENSSLSVYAQSEDSRGALCVQSGIRIGSGDSHVTLNGGTVTASGGNGAAIGGTGGDGSRIVINGGAVTANAEASDAGIGGADGAGSHIVINGGTVTANGGATGAGIGGAESSAGSYITVNGGTVTATGGSGAGIGGGVNGAGSHITINDGIVTVNAGRGAGVGGGDGGDASYIVINGGTVTAVTDGASTDSVRIGAGSGGSGSDISINGGTVILGATRFVHDTTLNVPYFIGTDSDGTPGTNIVIRAEANVLFNLTGLYDEEKGWLEPQLPAPASFEGWTIMTPATQTVDRVLVNGAFALSGKDTFTLTNGYAEAQATAKLDAEMSFAYVFCTVKAADTQLLFTGRPPALTITQQPAADNGYEIRAETDGSDGISNYAWMTGSAGVPFADLDDKATMKLADADAANQGYASVDMTAYKMGKAGIAVAWSADALGWPGVFEFACDTDVTGDFCSTMGGTIAKNGSKYTYTPSADMVTEMGIVLMMVDAKSSFTIKDLRYVAEGGSGAVVVAEGPEMTAFPTAQGERGTSYFCRVTYGHAGVSYTANSEAFVYTPPVTVQPVPAANTALVGVYTNGAEVALTGEKYLVAPDATVDVVFQSDVANGYYFKVGADYLSVVTNTVTATNDPTVVDGPAPRGGSQTGATAFAFLDDGVMTIVGSGVTYEQGDWPAAIDRQAVTSVRIASGVTGIGSRFFKKAYNLNTVTGGADLVTLGENAFYLCMRLESIALDCKTPPTGLDKAIVPVTAIKPDGTAYMIPSVSIPGYKQVLHGKKDLSDEEWTDLGSPEGQALWATDGYRFFRIDLVKEN